MAKLVTGILGGFAGKVGTVVGAIWKGIPTMRAYVASIANPNAPGQLSQRAKFAAVMSFLKPLTAIVRIGFKALAIKQTAFNAAMSANLKSAIMGSYPAFDIDYTKVKISSGNFPGALNPLAVAGVAGAIDVTWDDNGWETGANDLDESFIVVVNPAKEAAILFEGPGTRTAGQQTITAPNSYTGDEVQVYISFTNPKGSLISNSQYVSGLIVT